MGGRTSASVIRPNSSDAGGSTRSSRPASAARMAIVWISDESAWVMATSSTSAPVSAATASRSSWVPRTRTPWSSRLRLWGSSSSSATG